jgi:glutaminyl-peptide cyclotransferase
MNPNNRHSLPPFRRRAVLVAAIVLASGLAVAVWVLFGDRGPDGKAAAAVSAFKLEQIPFDGARAYGYLKRLCAIGPRPSGSAGMKTQQRLLAEYLPKLHGQVEFQRFRARDPRDRSWAPMANLIVRWHPQRAERILLCAHYDTLPYPLRDPMNPRGTFVGANDNASGVAVLMELARDMAKLESRYGVDFVFLDGEEYIFDERDPLFLGSEFFAEQYAREQRERRPPYHYRWGVLLDMVGAVNLQLPEEGNSAWWRDTRPLLAQIWGTAARLGVREFVPKKADEVDDDHIVLHNTGHIPCIDVIQPLADYPPWHTQGDTPDKCSPLSLAKVGWVIREWLKTAK